MPDANRWTVSNPIQPLDIIKQDFDAILNSIGFVDKIIFGRMHYNKEITAYKDHKKFYMILLIG